jgi:hypothetical protein
MLKNAVSATVLGLMLGMTIVPSNAQDPAQTNQQQDGKMKDNKMSDDKMMHDGMMGNKMRKKKKGKHITSKKRGKSDNK